MKEVLKEQEGRKGLIAAICAGTVYSFPEKNVLDISYTLYMMCVEQRCAESAHCILIIYKTGPDWFR